MENLWEKQDSLAFLVFKNRVHLLDIFPKNIRDTIWYNFYFSTNDDMEKLFRIFRRKSEAIIFHLLYSIKNSSVIATL